VAFQVNPAECWITPVPSSETVVGEPLALLTIEILPLTVPVSVGLNLTTKVMLWVGERVAGVPPPVIEYPCPVRFICEMLTLEFPVFVTVTVCVAELVPVVMFPKLRLVGLIPNMKVAAVPVPLSATGVGDVGASLTMEILPVASPTDTGRKFSVIAV